MKKKAPTRRPEFFSKQVFRSRLFYRDRPVGPTRGIDVVCGGWEQVTPDYTIDRATFPYWCVELICEGRGTLIMPNRKSVALRPGSLFVYGPRIRYRMVSDPAQPLTKYFADFTGRRATALLRELGFPSGSVAQLFPIAPLAETLEQLITAGLSDSPLALRRGALLLESFLIQCAESRPRPGLSHTRAFATFQRCRRDMDTTVPLLRNVREVADACEVDPAYLCRLFQRFHSCGPHRYMMRLRLQAATRHLSAGRLVKDVAEELGFSDAYHFSRAFKRFHGVPPEQFARRGRG